MELANTVIVARFVSLLLFFICYSHKLIHVCIILLAYIYSAGYLSDYIARKFNQSNSLAGKTKLLFNRIFHLIVYLCLFDQSYISFLLFFVIFVRHLAELIAIPFFKWLRNVEIKPEEGRYANMALILSLANIPMIMLSYHYKLWTIVNVIKYGPAMASFFLEAYLLFKLLSQITTILHKKD